MVGILILGAGAMGAALTVPAAENNNEVGLWFTEYDLGIYEALRRGEPHPRIRVRLPSSVRLYRPEEFDEAVEAADLLILAVSSQGVYPVSRMLSRAMSGRDVPVAVVSKGIELVEGEPMTMAEVVAKYSGTRRVVYVSGPSLAAELAARRPTFTVYSSEDRAYAEGFREVMETSYYRISVSDDVLGASLSAALKNPYAIAYGIIDGMEGGGYNNLKAALVAHILGEMAGIVERLGGRRETVYGLSGIGDVYVTMMGGRNSMFGRLIGSGLTVGEALREMERRGVGVVEGYRNSETLIRYLEARGLGRGDAPILYTVYEILHKGAPKEVLIKTLTSLKS